METENPLKGGNDLELQRNSEGYQPTGTKDDAEVRNVRFHLSSLRRNLKSCLHAEKRNIPIPLKYIDVTRMTHTNLDLLRESRVDDHWNVDVDRNVEVHIIKLKILQKIFTVKGTTRLHQLWPDISSDMSNAVQKKEKHEWTFKKWKADNKRRS